MYLAHRRNVGVLNFSYLILPIIDTHTYTLSHTLAHSLSNVQTFALGVSSPQRIRREKERESERKRERVREREREREGGRERSKRERERTSGRK